MISAPIANVESHAGTSDTGFYVTPYAMGGEIDEVRERNRHLSFGLTLKQSFGGSGGTGVAKAD